MKAIHLTDIFNIAQYVTWAILDDAIQLKVESFDREQYLANVIRFKDACVALGLESTGRQAERIENMLGSTDPTDGHTAVWARLKPEVVQLGIRFEEEIGDAIAYHLSAAEQDLYTNPTQTWQAALDSFPSALNDVEEAGKCLALGRHTAAVVHTMRILEFGLAALGREFSVSTNRATWHRIIEQIHDAIEAKSLALGGSWSDQTFYSGAATQMTFFKDAWRNHVMHGRVTFDEETAPPVIEYVRRFMSDLATKLSE